MQIVLICLSPLGDTLFATPAIRALREYYPKARILVLASPMAAEVLKDNPFNLQIAVAKDQWELLRLLSLVRKGGFDLAVSLSQVGSFFTKFCGTDQWADFSGIDYQSERTVVELCLKVLETIDPNLMTGPNLLTEFWFGERERRQAANFLKVAGYNKQHPLVAIHSGGRYFQRKRWPVANFIILANFLWQELDCQVVLIGGSDDLINSQAIQEAVPNVLNSVGRLKLAETAALLSKCRLLIGNDSGPLHLGAALHLPTLGLFGPTSPLQFYPYQPPCHHYLYKPPSCSPCYRFGGGIWQYIPRCLKAYCMEELHPNLVIDKCAQILNQTYQLVETSQ